VEIIQPDSSVSPEVRDYLERGIGFMYKFYITKFDYAFPKDLTVKIRVYRDLGDYKAYTSQVASSPISSHIGLYIHRLQEIVVWQGPDPDRFTKTVFHETSHLLLRSQTHYCPRWLNEGLSNTSRAGPDGRHAGGAFAARQGQAHEETPARRQTAPPGRLPDPDQPAVVAGGQPLRRPAHPGLVAGVLPRWTAPRANW
jgi:hypothetical protein